MDIIVTIKQVPDPEAPKESFRIDEEAKRILNPANVDPVINGYDENAIEAALQLKEAVGGKVTALCMGEESATRALKQALAMGVDEAILLHDPAFADADATATAYVLAAAIRKLGKYDLILCGRQASDWDQAQVPSGIAEYLDLPSVTAVQKVEVRDGTVRVERILEDGYEVIELPMPCLVTVSNEANRPRYPTLKGIMAAGKKQIPVWNAAALEVDPARVGRAGSLTRVVKLYIPRFEGSCEFIEGETPEEMGEKLALRLRELKII
ncbi:MAG: electron transfer flavoprotein subunit beta [Candidatus Tectimicrobiota bacterium]|nr:MAG: electron transfer flavoprotein subunit beta [Candidatus Tectomicrobia bacterium]